jgi:hypothetical protein
MGRIYNVSGSRIINGPKMVTDGLVLLLDAADKNSYPDSGTTWRDVSGNANIGTLINGPTFDSANGGSIFTDGVNDWVSTNTFGGSATDSYTFSAWFKNDNFDEAKYILGRGRDGNGAGWSLYIAIQTNGTALAGAVTTVPSLAGLGTTGTIPILLNTWYHITGVWTAGSSLKCYINGILDGTLLTSSTNLRTSTDGWWLGSITTTNFTSGYNAIMQVYNRVLSDAEILQNYNAMASRFA